MLAELALLAGHAWSSVPCSSPGRTLELYLEADDIHARDTVAHVRVCLAASRGARVSSFSARIVVDTAFGRVRAVERTSGPSVVAHADTIAGTVLVAGASSGGMVDGSLLTVAIRMRRPGTLPKMSIVLTEMNSVTGISLATRTTVSGLGPKCAGADPALFEVLPPGGSADPGEPLDLRITGCGFSADKNVIAFGDVVVRDVKSTDGGTHIRIVIPKQVRATTTEAPPMPLGAGAYDVTVNNGRGTSNAKRVILR
ncbi:MAG: hypothetical protein ACREPM_09445 [Gemmatimonadaceae bacterium]